MKKTFLLFFLLLFANCAKAEIISNEKIDKIKVQKAETIMLNLYNEVKNQTQKGHEPYGAIILDKNGKLISSGFDSVIINNSTIDHASILAIKNAQEQFKTYDLSQYGLSLYITSEPCAMCVSAIMQSGIKNVYFGMSAKEIKKLIGINIYTHKNWMKEFKKHNITVYGNIEPKIGEKILYEYIGSGGVSSKDLY